MGKTLPSLDLWQMKVLLLLSLTSHGPQKCPLGFTLPAILNSRRKHLCFFLGRTASTYRISFSITSSATSGGGKERCGLMSRVTTLLGRLRDPELIG